MSLPFLGWLISMGISVLKYVFVNFISHSTALLKHGLMHALGWVKEGENGKTKDEESKKRRKKKEGEGKREEERKWKYDHVIKKTENT